MADNKGRRTHLPHGIEIGQSFLPRFYDPRVEAGAYHGRLQDMSKSGLMCFDTPGDLRPRKGTPVTVRSMHQGSGHGSYSFSSEIRGRGRLRGRLPVLLVEPPEPAGRQCPAHHTPDQHLPAGYRHLARDTLLPPAAGKCYHHRPLNGGGAQVYTRQRPDAEYLEISLNAPIPFV